LKLHDIPTQSRPQPPQLVGKQRGKPRGKQRSTIKIHDAVLHAFDAVGGVEYLETVALTDPKTFCALLSRCIPQQVSQTITGVLTVDLAQAMIDARSRANQAAIDVTPVQALEIISDAVTLDNVTTDDSDGLAD